MLHTLQLFPKVNHCMFDRYYISRNHYHQSRAAIEECNDLNCLNFDNIKQAIIGNRR